MSENISRKNIIIKEIYKLETSICRKNNKYLLRVVEFEKEHSHFHKFELIKITHSKEFSIGVIDNKIVAYKNLILPFLIKNKKGENWTKKLSTLDDKAFFSGEEGDMLNIKFDNLQDLKNCHLIFRANLRASYPRINETSKKLERIFPSEERWIKSFKKIAVASLGTLAAAKAIKPENVFAEKPWGNSIYIYSNGHKIKLVDIIHPRERFSIGLVNLSEYIKKGDNSFSIGMNWTNSHNISFIGLVDARTLTSFQIKQETIRLSKLRHSENKDVNEKCLEDGKVDLIPGQFIELEFPAGERRSRSDNQKTSFVLKSKGYYTQF